jgi:hypothetical protein
LKNKKYKQMKKYTLLLIAFLPLFVFMITSCEKDDDNDNEKNTGEFSSLSSPYLICANRNPGGVGFDFEYNEATGGANNMDSVTVSDFKADVIIKTTKADNEGTASAVNYITLNNNAQAVNYSSIDIECTGITDFQNLTYETAYAKNITFASDSTGFDLTSLNTGTSGGPLLSEVTGHLKKLVIGDKWKATAKNAIEEDELIWIIKTSEGRWIKFIVTEFPSSNAPTANGYVSIEWSFLN